MIIHVKYIAVQGFGKRENIERFLYDHTKIVEHYEGEYRGEAYSYAVLRTEATSNERVNYFAKYQVERFQSGLYSAKIADKPIEVLPIGANTSMWTIL